MATSREEYSTDILDHLDEYNERRGKQFSSKSIQEAVLGVMEQKEEEIENNVNNIKMDTSFQSHVAMNAQKKDSNMSYERRLASGILAETIKQFKGYTIQLTINDSGY